MKVKAKFNKFHRVNPNGVICDAGSLDKLRAGESVEIPAPQSLLEDKYIEQSKSTIKKES